MLTDYTTYDDIRAALGVSSDEIEDATLDLETWDNHLQSEIEDISATLGSAYSTVVAVSAATRTDAQKKLYRTMRLFCTLATAQALTASLPMFGPKDISDGKAVVSRFADSPYKAVVTSVKGQYDKARERLKQALAEVNQSSSTSVARSYMSAAHPVVDPVTG